MFALNDTLSPDRFAAIYHSGSTAYYDALGFIELGKDIGVAVDRLNPMVEPLLRQYLKRGGRVFVDSGAYAQNRKWEKGEADTPEVNFDRVMAIYGRLLDGLTADASSRLALVMPDVLKQSERSLELLVIHRERILMLIATGANIIVPLQRGGQCAGDTAERVFAILGTRDITLGIPAAAAALKLEDAATIRNHSRFHILGRASMNNELYRVAYAVLEHNPGAVISCDATLHRTRSPELSQAQTALIEQHADEIWEGEYDDTELIYQVLHDNAWMTKPQVTALAHFYGIRDEAVIRSWIDAHKHGEEALSPVIERLDPEANLLWATGLNDVFRKYAEKHLSARLRVDAIVSVFSEEADQ